MSEPYLSEIRIMAFNFAPRNWAQCDGSILPIAQNQALYSLLGTTYGGDGRTSFALPELRGRVPVHFGSGIALGGKAGEETQALSVDELPAHTHTAKATSATGDLVSPATDHILASTTGAASLYGGATNLAAMDSGAVSSTGGGQGRNELMPFHALNFCIAIAGTFPSRN